MTYPDLSSDPDNAAGKLAGAIEDASQDAAPEPLLTAVEARVLGCLIEKKYTTPNSYPLTLSSLVQACNQKTSREPVMKLEPGEVGHAVGRLRDRKLVTGEFAGRTERYDERLARHLLLDQKCQSIVCSLMLRGPQTPGELRINASRMADFEDMEAVQEAIERLLSKRTPLVVKLPRMAGKREERYAHLLCGTIDEHSAGPLASDAGDGPMPGAVDDRISALESEVAALRAELAQLWRLTGFHRDDATTDGS